MLNCLPAVLVLLNVCAAAPSRSPAVPPPGLQQVAKALSITQDRIIDLKTCSLNGNQTTQTIVITCRTRERGHPLGGDVVVLNLVPPLVRRGLGGGLHPVWRQSKLNPWKLRTADVDGDGRREIVVGVWKKSPKDPVMAKRTFFYTWNGRRMLPKWLGSRLSRRFDDFTLADVNRDGWDELVSLEVAPKGRHRIAAYRWHSFGFEWLGCSAEIPGLTGLDYVKGKVVAISGSRRLNVAFAHGKVVLTK
jgi:hypothetical protein